MADKRIDLTGYDPNAGRPKSQSPRADETARRLSSFDGKSQLPVAQISYDAASNAQPLSYWLRAHLLRIGTDCKSIAIVDWTSMYHTATLFEGRLDRIDPFVALADFNAVLGAILFYDRILVIDGNKAEVVKQVGAALGVDDAFVSLPSNGGPRDQSGNSVFAWTLTDSFQGSAAILHNADPQSGLRVDLRNAWRKILPHSAQPQTYDVNELGWSTSPERPDLHRVLFSLAAGELWNPAAAEQLMIDNDVRAFSYERLAGLITAALSDQIRIGPTVRYVGGSLRAPLQYAMRNAWRRAWGAAGDLTTGPAAEAELNTWWQTSRTQGGAKPHFPFWTATILHECRSRDDFSEVVPKWRALAKDFRKSRTAFEQALATGDVKALDPYRNAMLGAIEKLPEAAVVGIGADVVGAATGASVALTGVPVIPEAAGAAVDGAASFVAPAVARWLLRASRPRLWFIARASDVATNRLGFPHHRLGELFELPPGDKSPALSFLGNVSAIEWAI